MKKIIFFIFLILVLKSATSQNLSFVKQTIDTLCSPSMYGRGYEFKGDSIAASFLASELKNIYVKPFNENYLQTFTISANTFSGNMLVKIDDKVLTPGVDYIVTKKSNSCSGKYKVETLSKDILSSDKKLWKFLLKKLSKKFVYIDTIGLNNPDFNESYKKINEDGLLNAKGIILTSEKLPTYSASTEENSFTLIYIKKDACSENIKEITVDIENEFIKNYETQNVIGYIQGEVDSFIVLTAHYDHLGQMGKDTYFPGAHDNASGVAMCLDLMKEFSNRKTPPHYSIAVIFFSGEESGLLGSRYYVENPVFPLEKIKFLLNIDMAGSGEDGIQLVNSTIFKDEYEQLVKINEENNYLKELKTRGSAANSDHYFFYEAGVPCFFIYTLGAYKEYHNINDKAEGLPLSDYEDYFRLLKKFIYNFN